MDIHKIASRLDTAALNASAVAQISLESQFDIETAYAIQKLSIEERYKRSEKFIGVKLGFTSKEKMIQMGVHDMIWGRLTDKMLAENNSAISISNFIHPRAEPEICFRIGKDINREINEAELLKYINGVCGAIEIIDSRYENFKFSLEDVIADNCSSSALVLGNWESPELDISNLNISLSFDSEEVASGNSNAILGNPWESVIAASRLCAQYGQALPAGSIIMAGAATKAVYMKKDSSVKASIDNLGDVSFRVK